MPLSQFATFEYGQEYPLVWRRDRTPTLTVQADVAPGVLPDTVVDGLAPAVKALSETLPPGYRIDTGGTVEESAKSQASVVAMVPLMLLVMLTVLMFELRSFQRLFLVLSVAPLGLIGVVAALLISGRPLGFVAILGVLALIGMITKNAVILIGQIESERAAGKDVRQAAIDASSARFTPIMLTAVSTVLGLIPIAPTVFWGPMAFAIMGGLLVGDHPDPDLPADALRHLVQPAEDGGERPERRPKAGNGGATRPARSAALDSKRRIAMLSVSDGFTFSNFLADALAIFLFVVWLWLLITVTNDLFRRHDISGWGKAAWVIGLILFSYLAIFIYLITQGKSMAQRNAEQAKEARAELRQAVGFSVADEIAKLDALKASGSISADEFSRLRAKLVQ